MPFSLILLGLQSSVNSDANPPLFAQISYGRQFIIGRRFIMVLAARTMVSLIVSIEVTRMSIAIHSQFSP